MDEVKFFGCYKYNRHWLLIEALIDEYTDKVDLGEFVVPEENESERNWQVAYLEQYLNAEGTERICGLYETLKEPVKPCRVAFFIYRTDGKILRTPYGEFSIEKPEKLPKRLKRIIEFEEDD